jgi:hypothetical protein
MKPFHFLPNVRPERVGDVGPLVAGGRTKLFESRRSGLRPTPNAARVATEVSTPRKSELFGFPFPAPSGTAKLLGVAEPEAAEEAGPIKLSLAESA